MISRLQYVLILLAGMVLLAACPAQPAEEPDLVATQVAVERAAAATLTAEALANEPAEEPTATTTATPLPPTDAPADTATPTTVPPTATPSSVPPTAVVPTPTPTQIAIIAFPVDGSDGNLDLHGSFIQSNGGRNVLLPGISQAQVTNPMIFRDRLPVRVEVFNEEVGNEDGDGIADVTFTISNPNGEEVFENDEETAPYCIWGGNEPNCPAPSFAELNYRWPGTGLPIENGLHSAEILINALDGSSTIWRWSFEIDHSGGEAAAPVELVLRPACGDNLSAPTNTPIDLIYGIWASRGYDRAAANQPYVQIELTVDGQTISGEGADAPVADLPQAICGSDYADSYWVYETARLDSLAPGVHYVRVTYRFSQAIEDGYGGTYTEPFTQQYVISVQ